MISPLSAECVPAMHLMRVDLPAPLSPTSAITSPLLTSMSTPLSAWTEPNDLVRFRSSRSGVSLIRSSRVGGAPKDASNAGSREMLLAVLRVRPDAHVALLQELVREEPLVVRLRDPNDRQSKSRLVLRTVLAEAVRLRLLTLDQCDCRRSGSVRLGRHVLVDRAALPTGEDVLHALHRCVLPGQRDRREVLRLQVG